MHRQISLLLILVEAFRPDWKPFERFPRKPGGKKTSKANAIGRGVRSTVIYTRFLKFSFLPSRFDFTQLYDVSKRHIPDEGTAAHAHASEKAQRGYSSSAKRQSRRESRPYGIDDGVLRADPRVGTTGTEYCTLPVLTVLISSKGVNLILWRPHLSGRAKLSGWRGGEVPGCLIL